MLRLLLRLCKTRVFIENSSITDAYVAKSYTCVRYQCYTIHYSPVFLVFQTMYKILFVCALMALVALSQANYYGGAWGGQWPVGGNWLNNRGWVNNGGHFGGVWGGNGAWGRGVGWGVGGAYGGRVY